jgi:hypothetical protein
MNVGIENEVVQFHSPFYVVLVFPVYSKIEGKMLLQKRVAFLMFIRMLSRYWTTTSL